MRQLIYMRQLIKRYFGFKYITNMQHKPTVIFILGGPGSGKGTQSDLIEKNYKFVHLSAGDLLRAERQKVGSENGALIEKYIVEGKIVPSEITVDLLKEAMEGFGWDEGKFLIDGFPRNLENLETWNKIMGEKVEVPFIIFLDCPEEVMRQRIIRRSEASGRSDDNELVLVKRFQTHRTETLPVILRFQNEDKLVRVNAADTVENVTSKISEQLEKRGIKKVSFEDIGPKETKDI